MLSQLFEALLLVQFPQRLNQRVHLAGDDLVAVEVLFAAGFSAEAVVGAAVLGEVVGADALGVLSGLGTRAVQRLVARQLPA